MFVITNINIIKKHLQTNKHTFNLFRQISRLDQKTKHCDRCDNDILKNKHFKLGAIAYSARAVIIIDIFNHANTRTMKKGKLNSPLKTMMGHLKGI